MIYRVHSFSGLLRRNQSKRRNVILDGMAAGQAFRFQTRIRFIDTDASGRIHYTAMFRYFESAEIEFMRTFGLTYTRRDFAFPRVHVECDFKLAMQHDDLIDIDLRLAKIGASSLRMEFETLNQMGQVAATGAVVIACMDRETQRSVPIPPELRAQLEPFLAKSVVELPNEQQVR